MPVARLSLRVEQEIIIIIILFRAISVRLGKQLSKPKKETNSCMLFAREIEREKKEKKKAIS